MDNVIRKPLDIWGLMLITCDPASSEVSASHNDLVIISSSQEWREAEAALEAEASSIIEDEGEFFIITEEEPAAWTGVVVLSWAFFSLVKISSNSSKDLEAVLE